MYIYLTGKDIIMLMSKLEMIISKIFHQMIILVKFLTEQRALFHLVQISPDIVLFGGEIPHETYMKNMCQVSFDNHLRSNPAPLNQDHFPENFSFLI